MLLVLYIFFKADCFPNSQDQEGFEAVLHQSRDSGKFWGGLRAGELIFFPPGVPDLSAWPSPVQKESSDVESEWVE